MRIAIASGKGGTGKTTIATNLAAVAAAAGRRSTYVDCDVEEPNGHIFLKPEIDRSEPVTMLMPVVDEALCTACGECGRICRFKAITLILDRVLTFHELCHACGGCALVCPVRAITERPREVGVLESGTARTAGGAEVGFLHGTLNVKEAMAPPVIRAVKREIPADGLVIVDAPPGASCSMVESVRGADRVILVTEPTPFGLNDLAIAVETVRTMGFEPGVVVNRDGAGDDRVDRWCDEKGIGILARIPDDRTVAEAYSRGELPVDAVPGFRARIEALLAVLDETGSAPGAAPGDDRTSDAEVTE
ncbi:MAG: ATP-binding protein [Candidatus Krumholzibacteriota bacterium]|nr:ATP-binding protein [Candidatus Krumholzibacteriota bacterium]